jgi:hypothetical protein
MIVFTTTILRFDKKGEKTGWTYIEIPAGISLQLKPGNKKSFRVKGKLDNFPIEKTALLPMGEGNFILPLNAKMRKGIGKKYGAMLTVQLGVDKRELALNPEMIECLTDEPDALNFFKQLSKSHQSYFSKWIDSAKTNATKAKRIAMTVNALSGKMNFGEMLRAQKRNNNNY